MTNHKVANHSGLSSLLSARFASAHGGEPRYAQTQWWTTTRTVSERRSQSTQWKRGRGGAAGAAGAPASASAPAACGGAPARGERSGLAWWWPILAAAAVAAAAASLLLSDAESFSRIVQSSALACAAALAPRPETRGLR